MARAVWTTVVGPGAPSDPKEERCTRSTRNAVNGGFLLPFESAMPVWQKVRTGDELRIEIPQGCLRNLTTGEEYGLRPLGDVLAILEAGDVFAYAKKTGLMK
jgi:3-isopropylmalate/(R)-2-methylmalate dehydratase small subunit